VVAPLLLALPPSCQGPTHTIRWLGPPPSPTRRDCHCQIVLRPGMVGWVALGAGLQVAGLQVLPAWLAGGCLAAEVVTVFQACLQLLVPVSQGLRGLKLELLPLPPVLQSLRCLTLELLPAAVAVAYPGMVLQGAWPGPLPGSLPHQLLPQLPCLAAGGSLEAEMLQHSLWRLTLQLLCLAAVAGLEAQNRLQSPWCLTLQLVCLAAGPALEAQNLLQSRLCPTLDLLPLAAC